MTIIKFVKFTEFSRDKLGSNVKFFQILDITVSAQKSRTAGDYVEVIIGLLTALVLLLLGVFLVVIVLNHRHKLENSPTAILKNPFGMGSMKAKVNEFE